MRLDHREEARGHRLRLIRGDRRPELARKAQDRLTMRTVIAEPVDMEGITLEVGVSIGMAVEAVLKPPSERAGGILDIAYFRPHQPTP